jgi:hypothetical protein
MTDPPLDEKGSLSAVKPQSGACDTIFGTDTVVAAVISDYHTPHNRSSSRVTEYRAAQACRADLH